MRQIKGLSFVEVQPKNIREIVEIHNSNVRGQNVSPHSGFLLAKTTEVEIQQNLNQGTNKYFVAVNLSGEVLGFLALAKPKISNDFLNQIIWQDDSCKDKILSVRHIYIKVVAIKLDYQSRGIGQFMYESLYEKFPNSFISAFIVSKPLCNERSLKFHEKQGFQQVGIWQQKQFLDLYNYESVLMFKEI
ncbi:GNAT family N-acetyltransferase [[Phormidium ambiguum] IAM M-71]|uniref:GNAT family N-acetyltransferase n=1 Tax=[Phormidium ambiguum] IAM M-71 TaxID=454136 RepID=A0A1U7I5Y4_9CYAN|nr:GNAT family N-acetyltransferase [Phormidium ambiguum]OKH31702.1 GNAT family N-acetyltransferase [Phormidium ambiguum IAM M-71]